MSDPTGQSPDDHEGNEVPKPGAGAVAIVRVAELETALREAAGVLEMIENIWDCGKIVARDSIRAVLDSKPTVTDRARQLEPDESDDEVLTMTRRQLRIMMRELLDLMLPSDQYRFEQRIGKDGNLYVRLDTITPEEIAR